MYNPNFDVDFAFGEKTEQWIKLIGAGAEKVEIKTERDTWLTTGNIAIEYEYKGRPSGIATTEADWWIHALSLNDKVSMAFIWRVDSLKNFLRPVFKPGSQYVSALKLVVGGDGNHSRLILLPIKMAHEII